MNKKFTPRPGLTMEIKQLTDTGSFEGVLATYGNVDLGGDLIEPGAFSKTIQEHGPEVKLLWQHDPANVIGTLQLFDGPDALRVKGQIEMDDDIPFSMTAYKLLKKNLLSGLSIGYDPIKSNIENGVRHLKELRLWEGSLVTFPMNELAGVTSVKAFRRKDDFSAELEENQLLAAPYQMQDAIFQSLYDMLWDPDLTRDERIAGSDLAIQQFRDAWLAWLPLFLDLMDEGDDGGMNYMRRMAVEIKTRIARKEGRRLSTATKASLKDCHANIKSADEILTALFDAEADASDNGDTSEGKAAARKAEPVRHSEAENLIVRIRALIPTKN